MLAIWYDLHLIFRKGNRVQMLTGLDIPVGFRTLGSTSGQLRYRGKLGSYMHVDRLGLYFTLYLFAFVL